MKKCCLFGVAVAMSLFACTDEDNLSLSVENLTGVEKVSLTAEEAAVLSVSLHGSSVSEADAQQKASDFLGIPVSRTDGEGSRVYWVKYHSSLPRMFSAGAKPDSIPLYLVNRRNGGSVLISGDERLPEILAYSEEDELSMEKNGSGLDVFIENLPDFISSEIDRFEFHYDSLLAIVQQKTSLAVDPVPLQRREVENSPWTTTYSYPQLINVTWNQGNPYNVKFPPVEGKNEKGEIVKLDHAYAGCVPVAIAQILSFYKYPVKFGATSINWVELTRYSSISSLLDIYVGQLQNLLYEIAEDEKIEIEYSWSGTSSNIYCANAYLNKIGYTTDGVQDYQSSKVKNSIGNSRPVYVRGSREEIIKGKVSYVGHAWVVDGAEGQKQTRIERVYEYIGKDTHPSDPIDPAEWKMISETSSTATREYVHCNWGWGGSNNGYFFHGVFSPSDNREYLYNQQMITNIKH